MKTTFFNVKENEKRLILFGVWWDCVCEKQLRGREYNGKNGISSPFSHWFWGEEIFCGPHPYFLSNYLFLSVSSMNQTGEILVFSPIFSSFFYFSPIFSLTKQTFSVIINTITTHLSSNVFTSTCNATSFTMITTIYYYE